MAENSKMKHHHRGEAMKKFIPVVFILLFVSSFCFAQESKQVNTVETRVGQSFTIALESNPTTGYRWQFAKPLDKNMLKVISASHSIDHPNLAGSGGKQIWTIDALNPGTTTIYLKYVRSWEKDQPPAKEESFVIVIKEKQAGSSAKTSQPDSAVSNIRVSGDTTATRVNRKGF